jgi:hypothetical protein
MSIVQRLEIASNIRGKDVLLQISEESTTQDYSMDDRSVSEIMNEGDEEFLPTSYKIGRVIPLDNYFNRRNYFN